MASRAPAARSGCAFHPRGAKRGVVDYRFLIELGGGLLLALGYKARWAALAIFLFLIPATLIFHAFWAVDPEQVKMQLIQFQKNLAIMGGMLYVVFNGPGRMSLDRV